MTDNNLARTLVQLARLEARGNIAIQVIDYDSGGLLVVALLSYEEDGAIKWGEATAEIPLDVGFAHNRDLLDFLWSGEVYENG